MKPSPFWSYLANCALTFSLLAASSFEMRPSMLASSDSNVVPCCWAGCVGCELWSGDCAKALANGNSAAMDPAISSLRAVMSCPLFVLTTRMEQLTCQHVSGPKAHPVAAHEVSPETLCKKCAP